MQRIAVLNSGGDAPGMNAAVASVARFAALKKTRLVGIIRGYNGIIRKSDALLTAFFEHARTVIGDQKADRAILDQIEQAIHTNAEGIMPDIGLLIDKYKTKLSLADSIEDFLAHFPEYDEDFTDLDQETVLDINNQPGSYLRTARCDDFRRPVVRLRAVVNLLAAGIEGLIVIGGDGSFQGATLLCQLGMPCIGIPGTIDNDLTYTEMTLGYDTAVNVCMHGVLQIRATSRSHDRPHVVEVMGRNCGDIALRTAMSTGAEIVIIREVPWNVEDIAKRLQTLLDRGNTRVTIIISEGAYASMAPFNLYEFLGREYEKENRDLPPEKHKRIWYDEPMSAHRLAEVLMYKCHVHHTFSEDEEERVQARATVLGYTQRGNTPSAYDAVFAYEAGIEAVSLLMNNEQDLVIGIKEGKVYSLSINDAFRMQNKEIAESEQKLQSLRRIVNQINGM